MLCCLGKRTFWKGNLPEFFEIPTKLVGQMGNNYFNLISGAFG
jgi:hypothetical protein